MSSLHDFKATLNNGEEIRFISIELASSIPIILRIETTCNQVINHHLL